ncbi:MAG: thioesterase family protein [Burkholderiales bacterium]|nr:thioesterase family protein [Burkholderiales bacterium]
MNLYLRLFLLLFRIMGLARGGLFDASRVAFRVLPNDCDLNLHMNNGRYLSFMDLGRVHLTAQLGLSRVFMKRRWMPVLAAAEINFIRPLAPLQKFTLVTRIVTWDEKYLYIEQKFEVGGVLHAHAFVKALVLSKQGRVSNLELTALLGYEGAPPPMPEELSLWVEAGSAKKQRADKNINTNK